MKHVDSSLQTLNMDMVSRVDICKASASQKLEEAVVCDLLTYCVRHGYPFF